MAIEEIEERLKDIICDYVDVDKNTINSETSLSYDIGIDSFGLISMIMSIENSFDIKIPDADLYSFHTFNDITKYIHAQTLCA